MVDLHGHYLGDNGAVLLARALSGQTQVREIDLHNCGVGESGGEALAKVLPELDQLEVLKLCANRLGAAAEPLVEAVLRVPVIPDANGFVGRARLRELDLRDNALPTEVKARVTWMAEQWPVETFYAGYDDAEQADSLSLADLTLSQQTLTLFARVRQRWSLWGSQRERPPASTPIPPDNGVEPPQDANRDPFLFTP